MHSAGEGRAYLRRTRWVILLILLLGTLEACDGTQETARSGNAELLVGIARTSITPTGFERFQDTNGNSRKDEEEPFYDTGADRLYDWQEPGALGPDEGPGVAGVDDDLNGIADDIGEFLSAGSDDLPDPHGDNFDREHNPAGTEGDGVFQAVVLAGFGGLITEENIRPGQDVHDDLYATSLAISSGGETLLLVSVDLVGLWHHYMNPVKRRLEQEMGVPFENIVVASTHTHAGPDSVGLWAYDFDTAYLRYVMEQMFLSAKAALESRESARMKSTTVWPICCYDKGTWVGKADPDCHLSSQEGPNFDMSTPYDIHSLQNDLRDPWVRNTKIAAMQFERPDTGSTIATLVNFHDHPEVFGQDNNSISSDYPHYSRRYLEERFGGVAIHFTGTCGCQIGVYGDTPVPFRDEQGRGVYEVGVHDAQGSPVPMFTSEMGEEKVRSLGLAVGEAAAEGLLSARFSEDPHLEVRTEYLDVVPENLISQLYALYIIYLEPNFPTEDLPVREAYCPPVGCARVPISVVRLGDASLITSPGETAPEYMVGRVASEATYPEPYAPFTFPAMPAIEDHMPGRDKFIIGLANGYFGYLVPASDYLSPFTQSDHPNYYEDEVCPGPNFGDSVGNKILQLLGKEVRFSDYPIRP